MFDTIIEQIPAESNDDIDNDDGLEYEPTEEEHFWDRADWHYQQDKEDKL